MSSNEVTSVSEILKRMKILIEMFWHEIEMFNFASGFKIRDSKIGRVWNLLLFHFNILRILKLSSRLWLSWRPARLQDPFNYAH